MRHAILERAEPECVFIPVLSLESSSAIPFGCPVAFKMDASTNTLSAGFSANNDGVGVCLPSVATAVKASPFFAGIAVGNVSGTTVGGTGATIPAGKRGLAQVFGICQSCILLLSTRAATTDVWASQAAYALGDQLIINTVANAMSGAAVGAATAFLPFAVNASFTQASVTTTGSTAYSVTFSAATAMTTFGKVFLRAM